MAKTKSGVCVYCGGRVPWPKAGGVVFGTGEDAHVSCYEAAGYRHPSLIPKDGDSACATRS